MPNGDLYQFYCFYCRYFSKSKKMIAHEKWSAKQKPAEVLGPEEYDKKYGTNVSKESPKPISCTVLKMPSKNEPQFDTSGRCKFHKIDIAESFEGMVCLDWKTKEDEALIKSKMKLLRKQYPEAYKYLNTFKAMVFKKLKPGYLYHWIYKTKLPKKPSIVYRTDTDYVLIREAKIK